MNMFPVEFILSNKQADGTFAPGFEKYNPEPKDGTRWPEATLWKLVQSGRTIDLLGKDRKPHRYAMQTIYPVIDSRDTGDLVSFQVHVRYISG